MLSKEDREAGYRSVPQPSEREVAILRRVARGFLLRTQTEKGPRFHYEDGSPMTALAKAGSRTDDASYVDRMVQRGFLIPIAGESLDDEAPPQRYRARTVEDGALPKIRKAF